MRADAFSPRPSHPIGSCRRSDGVGLRAGFGHGGLAGCKRDGVRGRSFWGVAADLRAGVGAGGVGVRGTASRSGGVEGEDGAGLGGWVWMGCEEEYV